MFFDGKQSAETEEESFDRKRDCDSVYCIWGLVLLTPASEAMLLKLTLKARAEQ